HPLRPRLQLGRHRSEPRRHLDLRCPFYAAAGGLGEFVMSNSPSLNLFLGFASLASDLVCGDRLFSFVMRERPHRIAIIGMLVTAILGASLAIRDIIHHSIAPDSSIAH